MADHTEVMKAVSQLPYTNTFYPVLVPNIKGGYILVTLLALVTPGIDCKRYSVSKLYIVTAELHSVLLLY